MGFQTSLSFEKQWHDPTRAVVKASLPASTLLITTGRRKSGNLDAADAHIQKNAGDIAAVDTTTGHVLSYHEIKMEARHTGNLFIETWSNLANTPDRVSEGWLYSCQADVLWYGFADILTIHEIDMPKLRAWLCTPTTTRALPGVSVMRLSLYREIEQGKSKQKNHTVGRLVPIKDIKAAGLIVNTHTLEAPDETA